MIKWGIHIIAEKSKGKTKNEVRLVKRPSFTTEPFSSDWSSVIFQVGCVLESCTYMPQDSRVLEGLLLRGEKGRFAAIFLKKSEVKLGFQQKSIPWSSSSLYVWKPLAPSCQYIWKLHRPLVPNIFPQLEDEGYVWSLTFDLAVICYVLKGSLRGILNHRPSPYVYFISKKRLVGFNPFETYSSKWEPSREISNKQSKQAPR